MLAQLRRGFGRPDLPTPCTIGKHKWKIQLPVQLESTNGNMLLRRLDTQRGSTIYCQTQTLDSTEDGPGLSVCLLGVKYADTTDARRADEIDQKRRQILAAHPSNNPGQLRSFLLLNAGESRENARSLVVPVSSASVIAHQPARFSFVRGGQKRVALDRPKSRNNGPEDGAAGGTQDPSCSSSWIIPYAVIGSNSAGGRRS